VHAIDFNDPAFLNDPYPVYRQLRELDGPYWLPHIQPLKSKGMWLFSRYDEVVDILKMTSPLSKQISRDRLPGVTNPMDLTMLQQDPPEHTRLRNLVKQAFTTERIKALEPRIEQITDEFITQINGRTTGDFIVDIALPLPLMVIAVLLGIPVTDNDRLYRCITHILAGFDSVTANQESLDRQKSSLQELTEYFNTLIEQRQKIAPDGLICALIGKHDQQNQLTRDELLGMCVLLLVAGYETTISLLGTGLYTLLRHPDQLGLLKHRPEYLSSAIEEMLRFESPLQRSTFRITTQECDLGGIHMRRGEHICAMIGAANRDPNQFSRPDTFDIIRTPNRHLAFGTGIHTCLGAMLARMEAHIAFNRILERLPNIRLAAQPPAWNKTTYFRGLHCLPVCY
jgi:cytochrome P450